MKFSRIVIRYFTQVPSKEKPNVTQKRGTYSKVEKRDIIDAEFEEIPDKKE